MISNWEDAKKRSNYHFNKKIKDTDNVKHIGRFVGTWKDEVDNVINDTNNTLQHFLASEIINMFGLDCQCNTNNKQSN